MCGIAGFNWRDEQLAIRMTDALRHRGPDDEGIYADEDVSLGHRRLSILDLSKLGHQPMDYAHGGRRVVITYNGEIYNFREIRQQLEQKGYTFRSSTDTEIIPAAYLEWGAGCVEKFNGMWAFALYDSSNKQLLLSRDRFGEKPLYYYLQNGKLVFASEIKAILEHPVQRRSNSDAVSEYLYKGRASHKHDTFFQGIKMLPPAHNAVLDLRSGSLSLTKYYTPQFGSRRVSRDEFLNVMKKSVDRRLVSDVPVSVSLSSGVDSSSIAALMSEFTDIPVKAFTTATGLSVGDETGLIRKLLKQYPNYILEGTSLSEASFCANYRHIIYHMDEPFARQSSYVRWEIANLTRLHGLKVLLNGEGADEILGGYVPFAPHYLLNLARNFNMIRFVREVLFTLTHPERKRIFDAFHNATMAPWRNNKYMDAALNRQRKFGIRLSPAIDRNYGSVDLKEYLYALVSESSLPRLLNCNDKMTMANSVEARAPFLDHEFVDMAFSMDRRDYLVNGRRKYPLRNAMRGLVPDEILFRKDKDAFNAPIFNYLRAEPVQKRIRELFKDPRTSKIFSPKAYLDEYERFLSRKASDRLFLLHGFILEEWSGIFNVEYG